MKQIFEVELLPKATEFLEDLDEKTRGKVYYNMKKTQFVQDDELFKKLNDFIWEFRTLYNNKSYRLFAFWDNTEAQRVLVIATHGIHKKTQKTPPKEIEKAENIRREYMNNKIKKNNIMDNSFKTISLDTMIDKHIGMRGTPKREAFENELRIDLLGHAIKQARLERHLTQQELGELIGVQKSQISKVENSIKDSRFDTILKVFEALGAKVNFNVELNERKMEMAY